MAEERVHTDRILRLADALEHLLDTSARPRVGFSMATIRDETGSYDDMSGHDCRIVCCISGWCDRLWPRQRPEINPLGIGSREWSVLIRPRRPRDQYSLQEAVATLRHLAETGVVDWERHRDLRPAHIMETT